MRGRRRKLPVLATLEGPPNESRVWSLRRADLDALAKLHGTLEGCRTVLLTGEEGLTAAIGLAGAAGTAGRRTALLECDLARPRLAAELGLAPAPGLHEYLRWEATAPQILQPLVLAGPAAQGVGQALVCVAAGRLATDAAALTALDSFRHAVAKLRAAYELLVLTGPAPSSADGSLSAIAAQADTLIAAVAPDAASGRSGRDLRAALGRLPVEARGAILVGAD